MAGRGSGTALLALALINPTSDMYWITANSAIVVAVLTVIAHVLVAVGIYHDAKTRKQAAKPLAFFIPEVWTLLGLVGGLLGLLLYWVMHYSTLQKDTPPS